MKNRENPFRHRVSGLVTRQRFENNVLQGAIDFFGWNARLPGVAMKEGTDFEIN